jgi:hypothetical protein
MWEDPIVAEVRQARETHAAQFSFDLWAIYRALKEQEEQSQHEKVAFAPKHILPVKTEMKPALVA